MALISAWLVSGTRRVPLIGRELPRLPIRSGTYRVRAGVPLPEGAVLQAIGAHEHTRHLTSIAVTSDG
jgi:hypothetical protein